MSPVRKNIDIIHSCERHFYNWLKTQLVNRGIIDDGQFTLSGLLSKHIRDLGEYKQILVPLNNWDKRKKECYKIDSVLANDGELQDADMKLFEQTAFEGQILLLTFQEN